MALLSGGLEQIQKNTLKECWLLSVKNSHVGFNAVLIPWFLSLFTTPLISIPRKRSLGSSLTHVRSWGSVIVYNSFNASVLPACPALMIRHDAYQVLRTWNHVRFVYNITIGFIATQVFVPIHFSPRVEVGWYGPVLHYVIRCTGRTLC